MISVEQIRLLETKVQKAVSMLATLQEENAVLKARLSKYESRIDELEFMIEEFKEDQTEIEQGIISALNKLDGLESVARELHPAAPSSEQPAPTSARRAPDTEQSPQTRQSEATEEETPQVVAPTPEEMQVAGQELEPEQTPEPMVSVEADDAESDGTEFQSEEESEDQSEEDPNQLEIF